MPGTSSVPPEEIHDGEGGLPDGLYWSINTRFLAYLARMPDGRCSATGGAAFVDGKVFHFEPAAGGTRLDPASGSGVLRFSGDVRFAGHHGFLFVRIGDPWLTVEHGRASLSIAAQPGESARLTLVTLRLEQADHESGRRRLLGTSVRLTAAGTELFGDAYPEGEPFDDLTVLGHL